MVVWSVLTRWAAITFPRIPFPYFWVRVGPKRNLLKIWKAQSSKENEESGWVCWQRGRWQWGPACPHSLHSVCRSSSQLLTLLINCSRGPTLRGVCSPTGLPKASHGLPPSLWQLDMPGFWLPGGCPLSSSNPLDLWGVFEAPDAQRKGWSWGGKLCQLYHRRHTWIWGTSILVVRKMFYAGRWATGPQFQSSWNHPPFAWIPQQHCLPSSTSPVGRVCPGSWPWVPCLRGPYFGSPPPRSPCGHRDRVHAFGPVLPF